MRFISSQAETKQTEDCTVLLHTSQLIFPLTSKRYTHTHTHTHTKKNSQCLYKVHICVFSNTGVPLKINTHTAFNSGVPVSGPWYYACRLADMQSQLNGTQPSLINVLSHTCAFSALTSLNECSEKSLSCTWIHVLTTMEMCICSSDMYVYI